MSYNPKITAELLNLADIIARSEAVERCAKLVWHEAVCKEFEGRFWSAEDVMAEIRKLDAAPRLLIDQLRAANAEIQRLRNEGQRWPYTGPMLLTTARADLEAARRDGEQEVAWLCERGDGAPTQYVCVNPSGFFDWTPDVNKALRLCRREDADAVAAIVDDCWRVVEHMWVSK